MFFVGYKGGAPMVQDLMAGQILVGVDEIVNLIQPHKAGKVRMIALTSSERIEATPDVPTFTEGGYPSVSGGTWIGASVRKGTPAARIDALVAALNRASERTDVQRRLAALGLRTITPSPQGMARTIQSDTARYAQLVQAAGLKVE